MSKDVTLSVVIGSDDLAWLRQKAKLEDRSVSAVMRKILADRRQQEGPLPLQLNVKPGQDY